MTGLRFISDIIKSSGYVPVSDTGEYRQAELPGLKAQLASIATVGMYVMRGINYKGDTRGAGVVYG